MWRPYSVHGAKQTNNGDYRCTSCQTAFHNTKPVTLELFVGHMAVNSVDNVRSASDGFAAAAIH